MNKRGARGGRRGRPSRGGGVQQGNGRLTGSSEGVDELALQEPRSTDLEDQGARKRRKTCSPAPSPLETSAENKASEQVGNLDWHQQLQQEAERNAVPQVRNSESEPVNAFTVLGNQSHKDRPLPTEVSTPDAPSENTTKPEIKNPDPDTTSTPAQPRSVAQKAAQTTPEKRILRVHKSGKLLSSPPKSPKPGATMKADRPAKRRRKATKEKPNLAVVIKYGTSTDKRLSIGQKIDDILNGKRAAALPNQEVKKAPEKPKGPPKPTHPFFMGKAKQKEGRSVAEPTTASVQAPLTNPKKSTITPGKLLMESRGNRFPSSTPSFMPGFGQSRPTQPTGMSEAPWPSRDCTHVRNIDIRETQDFSDEGSQSHFLKPRKLKGRRMVTTPEEDMLSKIALHLKPLQEHVDRPSQEHIRLPERVLTSGSNIQEKLTQDLHVAVKKGLHPAVRHLYDLVGQNLTPFDKGLCESQAWLQKYAPASADQVLQVGKEARLLRDWLSYLTISSENGAELADSKKQPKKRRKKTEDDFIVSDDDDGDELLEVSDGEIQGRTSGPKSLKRPRMSRNKNVFLLSGPHGCGKSATVYAVAKELGFEVFEINSGTRRSAKDIQDRVGDMLGNHLVHHQRDDAKAMQPPTSTEDADMERMSKALQKDIDSGRQGTMASFFKSKPPKDTKSVSKKSPKQPAKSAPVAQPMLPGFEKRRRQNKQSLILFEEADILFEEDQQFWGQVMKLAFQTKRPVVITCNNETLIPTYGLPLGAILRLSPPPVPLAADYLLTLAAVEGHLLQRKAVCDLYQSRNYDLRASIAELDFWCQMSVGDRKGGLDWIYQRWPPGSDVDEHGRVIRVVSDGTYPAGMGMLSHDVATAQDTYGFDKEASVARELWADWGVIPDVCRSSALPVQNPTSAPDAPSSRLKDLEDLDCIMDALSSADIFCRIGLPTYESFYEEPTDPTLPPRPEKERLDYTTDARFLQVDHALDYSHVDTDISIQTHLGLKRAFGRSRCYQLLSQSQLTGQHQPTELILDHASNSQQPALSRPAFSTAFDILGYPSSTTLSTSTTYPLTASNFDRAFKIIVEDLAPYIRSIVAHEVRLENERLRLGSLLSEGGSGSRRTRMRMTKASRVAMEGGTRQSKRRERWFDKELNRELVMGTAGSSWAGMGLEVEGGGTEGSVRTGESGELMEE